MVDAAARIDGYARAFLDVARAEGDPDGIVRELSEVGRGFARSEELHRTLADPAMPFERKRGVLSDLLGARTADTTMALVTMLVAAGRIRQLPEIADRMIALAAEAEDYAVAEVRTPIELDDATVARLTEKLAAATGRRVKPRVIVDPDVIGGVVVTVGDTVFDGSVRSRLNELREAWG